MGTKISYPAKKTDVDVKYETYINNMAVNNRATNLYGTENSEYVCDMYGSSKGTRAIDAMKRLENDKQMKEREKTQVTNEKFKGFAYKNNRVEPFEKVYISY